MKTFDLSINEGIFYLKSQSSFRILPDDLVAFRMQDAQLAYRDFLPGDQPDYKLQLNEPNPQLFDSKMFKTINTRKYYLRLIVSEPLEFTIPHFYEQSGHYPIKFLLKNEFDSKTVNRTSPISVQSIISKMRLTIKPPNTAVGKKINIVAQLNKGSNIQLIWDYGDGNQTTEFIPSMNLNLNLNKTNLCFIF